MNPKNVTKRNQPLQREAGSFRDRANQVYYVDGRVLRGLSETALAHWHALVGQKFFQKMLKKGRVIGTELLAGDDGLGATIAKDGWSGVLEHRTLPMVTYPYEWTFGMLKDAALLHLDLLEELIENDWILKDATAYNVQWIGPKPTFIDVVSFEPLQKNAPWIGYRQFCMMFLIPLLLKAHRDIDYIPFLRSDLEGISPAEAVKFFSFPGLFKKGVFMHVYLHSKLQVAYSDDQPKKRDVSNKKVKHTKAMVLGTIQGLRRLVKRLKLKNQPTTWGDYDQKHSYSDESFEQKQAFVQRHVEKKHWGMIWDIGCNTGTFSKLCSPFADSVLSIDGDAMAIEKLYQQQKREEKSNILPLIMNLGNLSPNQGWRGQERKALEERGTPDFLLCLALIHHMVISANIPMRDFLAWIRSLDSDVILEFVGPEDEMTQHLLKNRVNQYTDYTEENFDSIASEMFTIVEKMPLKSGRRQIYYLQPQSSSYGNS